MLFNILYVTSTFLYSCGTITIILNFWTECFACFLLTTAKYCMISLGMIWWIIWFLGCLLVCNLQTHLSIQLMRLSEWFKVQYMRCQEMKSWFLAHFFVQVVRLKLAPENSVKSGESCSSSLLMHSLASPSITNLNNNSMCCLIFVLWPHTKVITLRGSEGSLWVTQKRNPLWVVCSVAPVTVTCVYALKCNLANAAQHRFYRLKINAVNEWSHVCLSANIQSHEQR